MENSSEESKSFFPAELVGFYELCKQSTISPQLKDAFIDSLRKVRFKTMQVLLWTCDNKIGLGTDGIFKELAPVLATTNDIDTRFKQKIVKALARLSKWHLIVELLKHDMISKLRVFIFNEIKKALKSGNVNCAKAMPRKGEVANRIRGYLLLSPKAWRKVLVDLCKTQLPVLMSSNRWDKIDYNKLPTHLIVQHYYALRRHDKERFRQYLDDTPARAITISRIIKSPTVKPVLPLYEVLASANYFTPINKESK